MSLGHRHGVRVNTIFTPDSSANNLPIVFFTVHPTAPGAVVITDIVLEEAASRRRLRGRGYGARARVVMGAGTGPFRVVFYMDGTAVAMEEGFMENGRPVTIEPRGPIASRRLGERRLHVAVESPQILASRPVTFLSLPPPVGLEPKRREEVEADTTAADSGWSSRRPRHPATSRSRARISPLESRSSGTRSPRRWAGRPSARTTGSRRRRF